MKLRPSTTMKRGGRRIYGATNVDRARPVPVADPIQLRPDVERRVRNWAMWRSGGRSLSRAMEYSALASILRGQTLAETDIKSIPEITAEAEEMDRAIKALPEAWFTVLLVWWCKGGSVRHKARMCGCRKEAMMERLALAHRSLERQFS